MAYILGIDIGTGSVKVVALDLNHTPIAVFQEHYPAYSPEPGYSEQDPELIWQAFVRCILKTMAHLKGKPLAVGLSSAMHSVVAIDEHAHALAPMMTWADNRSAPMAERLLSSGQGMLLYKVTGTPIHAMSPFCKLAWLSEQAPVLMKHTFKFIGIKEYIWHRLFGAYEVDHSIASSTGLFDIRQKIWHPAALRTAGIRAEQLSDPVATSHTRRGHPLLAASLPGLSGVPFVIGASDGCLANLGTQAMRSGVAAITIGTSGAVRVASARPVISESMVFSYLLDESTFICGGPVNNGGVVLQWLLKNVFGKPELRPADYEWLFKLAESVPPGSDGLIFLPYLSGERAPIWDAAASGSFSGLRLHHGQAHLARAVLEGICYALNDVLITLEQHAGPVKQVNVSGGFVHSVLWMQLLADITGKTLVLRQTEDASATGAAYLAARATGLSAGYPQPPVDEIRISPDQQRHAVYLNRFALFRQRGAS